MSIDAQVEKLREKYNIGRIKIRLGHDSCWWVYIDWNFKGEIAYPRNAQGTNTDLKKAFKSAGEDVGKH